MEYSLKPSSEYFKSLSGNVQRRITCERAIARALVKEAIKRGYVVSVWNGENYEIKRSRSVEKIIAALHTTDDDILRISLPLVGGDQFARIGTFTLIYGNSGYDVVSDFSWVENEKRNTREIMEAIDKAAQPVADRWEKRIDGF